MFILKDLIEKVFGGYYILKDSYKDSEGKGINQRYHEMLADDMDETILPLIVNLQEKTLDPLQVVPKYIYYLEMMLGINFKLRDDIALRRKVMQYSSLINKLRGTSKSYEILFKLLGFIEVEIIEHPSEGGFDTWTVEGSFDDGTFDSACPSCSGYSLLLTGTLAVTPDFTEAVYNIIVYCEPIDAYLVEVKYNGIFLSQNTLQVFIDVNGDLIYNNENDPFTNVFINADGDLVFSGLRAMNYIIDENGDLIFNS